MYDTVNELLHSYFKYVFIQVVHPNVLGKVDVLTKRANVCKDGQETIVA